MREFYQLKRHIWQQRSIRISIGRRQRRVRDRGLPDPLPDPKSSGTKKRLVNTTLTNLLEYGGPSQT